MQSIENLNNNNNIQITDDRHFFFVAKYTNFNGKK